MNVDYPCQRWVSRACEVTFFKAAAEANGGGEGDDDSVGICPACSSSDTNGRQSYRVRPGRQFNRKIFALSFGLKNGLRFRFGFLTCLNYPFLKIFLV